MQRRQREYCLLLVTLLCLIIPITDSAIVKGGGERRRSPVTIPVGVILDSGSSLGSMALNCTNIALQDFYSTHDSYSTKLQLHFRDSGDDLSTAASAARDLINIEKVHAIVGPQKSEQARFVVELGDKSDVPVIWFSTSGPSLLPPFFNNSDSGRSQCLQFEAIAAIIEAYYWESVIPIYEDPEFGNDLIPCLSYALQEMGTRVPYISAIRQDSTIDQITEELKKLKDKRTYVFLAHMSVELWSRLVKQVEEQGMMSKGYAWMFTQGLSSAIDPEANDIKAKGYMEGALGVRPSLAAGSNITNKRISLGRRLMSEYNKTLSINGLWAYDTITALANAVEKAGSGNSTSKYRNETGPELRRAILDTNFAGLSGNFSLRKGQLEPSQLEVYNVNEKRDMTIGYWRPETGLFQNYGVFGEPTGKYKLMDPIWPGNTSERPPKLKIGVPKTHFTEFVDLTLKREGILATGFAVDVFKRVVDALPFNLSYEFVPVTNRDGELTPSNYDDLLCNITNKNLNAMVGDITIVMSRTDCVDFTMPYLDSSMSMVVKVEYVSKSEWILFKPFDRDLWLILGAIFVGATVIVITLEGKMNGSKFVHFVRNPFLIYISGVDSLKNGISKWVVMVVMFLLGLVMQIYTANLTSILIERTMATPFPWKDLQEIKKNNVSVGYQRDSWVRDLLIHQIGLRENQLMGLQSREEYDNALSKGSKKGRVDVIFDETPYLKLFLSKCTSCKITGPIYQTGGFAFAFRKNSTLVSIFSTAILKVTQNVTTFLPITIDKSEYRNTVEWRSLMKDDFGELFPIVYSVLALFLTISILKLPYIYSWLHSTSIYRWLRSTPIYRWFQSQLVSQVSGAGGGVSN